MMTFILAMFFAGIWCSIFQISFQLAFFITYMCLRTVDLAALVRSGYIVQSDIYWDLIDLQFKDTVITNLLLVLVLAVIVNNIMQFCCLFFLMKVWGVCLDVLVFLASILADL